MRLTRREVLGVGEGLEVVEGDDAGAGAQRRHGAAGVVHDVDAVAAGARRPASVVSAATRRSRDGARHRRDHGAEPLGQVGVGVAEAAVARRA